jgi:tetratricopeptide (TPR) repeat protein
MMETIQQLEAKLASYQGLSTLSAEELRHKIDMLNEFAWELRNSDPQRGLKLSQQAYELADSENNSYRKGMAYSLRNMAEMNVPLGNYNQTFAYALQAQPLFESLIQVEDTEQAAHQEGLATLLRSLGAAYSIVGQYSEALAYLSSALELARTVHQKEIEIRILNNIGIVQDETGSHADALHTYRLALQIADEQHNTRLRAKLLNNIAMSYLDSGDFEAALQPAQEALHIAQAIGDHLVEHSYLDTLGNVYLMQQDLPRALGYFQQALEVANILGVKPRMMKHALNIGELYFRQHQHYAEHQPSQQTPNSYTQQALSYFQQALGFAEECDSKIELFTCHRVLAKFYKATGDIEQALHHYEQFHTLKEQVFNEESDKKLKSLHVIHQTEMYQLRNVELEREIAERKRAEEGLRQAHEEIRLLSNQLRAENTRMSAELAVTHRLQQMILPDPAELAQIAELDIAGVMQPATEVGGDYYSGRKHRRF